MAKEKVNEQATAAASYILSFYQNVQTLTASYANYKNLLETTLKTHNLTDADSLNQDLKGRILELLQETKYYIEQTQIQYESIYENTISKKDKEKKNELSEAYDKIEGSKELIPKTKEIRAYVVAANKALTNDIIEKLLENSEDIINSIYAEGDGR